MKESNDFGKFLKDLRVSQKLSVRALSENAGVSHSYLSQVENGKRGVPSPEVIRKIATALVYDYFSLMRVAGYMTIDTNKDYSIEEFVSTIKKRLTVEQKREFLVSFKEAKSDFFHSINEDRFIKNDIVNSTKNNLDDLFGLVLEENLHSESPFWYKWRKELDDIFEGDNFKNWVIKKNELTGIKKNVRGDSFTKPKFINIHFNYPRVDQINGEDIELSEEEAKERFLYLENLLTMDENIYLNSKVLSKTEKIKVLQMLKLVFDETPEETE